MENKKDISFILPTNRDPVMYANKVVGNINSLNFRGKTHEIIVVGPAPITGDNVTYLKESNPASGCVAAYNEGYNVSSGNYIVLCSDDHYFDLNCPLITEVLSSRLFEDRKYKVICLPTNNHGPSKLPGYTNCDNIIARYPVFLRETIEEHLNGYIYHPSFRHHYPDNWLGFWLAKQGEPALEINKFDMLTFSNSCDKVHDKHDEAVFKELIQAYEHGSHQYVKP
jgi:hypothetical protein